MNSDQQRPARAKNMHDRVLLHMYAIERHRRSMVKLEEELSTLRNELLDVFIATGSGYDLFLDTYFRLAEKVRNEV